MIENVGSAVFEHGAGLADCFGPVHGGGIATVHEEQVGFAFAGCFVCPVVEGSGMFGHS